MSVLKPHRHPHDASGEPRSRTAQKHAEIHRASNMRHPRRLAFSWGPVYARRNLSSEAALGTQAAAPGHACLQIFPTSLGVYR